jgi:hypothetical protein
MRLDANDSGGWAPGLPGDDLNSPANSIVDPGDAPASPTDEDLALLKNLRSIHRKGIKAINNFINSIPNQAKVNRSGTTEPPGQKLSTHDGLKTLHTKPGNQSLNTGGHQIFPEQGPGKAQGVEQLARRPRTLRKYRTELQESTPLQAPDTETGIAGAKFNRTPEEMSDPKTATIGLIYTRTDAPGILGR